MAQTNMRRIREDEAFHNLNDDLIYEFFAVFSRFEYALKNGGYLSVWTVPTRSGEEKQYHGPDWRRFARHTERDYQRARCDNQSEFYQATTYILSQPPKLEIAIQTTNGTTSPIWKVDFEEFQPPTSDEKLLINTLIILRTSITWRSRLHTLYRELK